MARRGRKRKTVKREPSGRVPRESKDQIREVAVSQRLRLVSSEQASNELAGFPLGILFLRQHIPTRRLVDAGARWAQLVASYARIVGIPSPNPRACQMNANFGTPLVSDLPDDVVNAIKSNYNSAFIALRDAGHRPTLITNDIVVRDEWPSAVTQDFLPDLLIGLEALAMHFKIR